MKSILKKIGFASECIECGNERSLRKCPHCDAIVCSSCLERLVQKDSWPVGLKGKKVSSYEDLKNILHGYCEAFRTRKIGIHCCDKFIEFRWKDIESLIYQEQAKGKKVAIVLK